MKKTFLAASLVLLPLAFACQPEIETSREQESTAQSADETLALEKKSSPSVEALSVMGLTGIPFASMEAVETSRYENPWQVSVATDYYVTFWADRARTSPVNLGSAIQLNYTSTYYNYMYNNSMRSNLSKSLSPGSHSYYIGSGSYECYYGANGNMENRCDETWLSLRTGVGYDASY